LKEPVQHPERQKVGEEDADGPIEPKLLGNPSDGRADQRWMGENDIEYGQVAHRADGRSADVSKDSGRIYRDDAGRGPADGDFGGATTTTADEIIDFASGADKIDLSAVDANTLLAGDQAFSFIGTSAFSDTAGELRYEQISGNTYITGDTNGDGIADFMIKVDGAHVFVVGDFGI